MKASLAVGISLLTVASSPAGAEEEPPRGDAEITLLAFEVAPEALLAASEGRDEGEVLVSLRELVAKREAAIFDALMLRTRIGDRSSNESVVEKHTRADAATGLWEMPRSVAESRAASAPAWVPGRIPPVPTSFGVRNTGTTLEALVSRGGALPTVVLAVEWVSHAGDNVFADHRDARGDRHQLRRARFQSLQLNQQVVCREGEWKRCGVLSRRQADGTRRDGKVIVVIMRCVIHERGE